MDIVPPLKPIVIDPLDVTLDHIIFTYKGEGLLNNGHRFDRSVSNYLPLLEPARTQTGKVWVHQPRISKQPLAYWKAQCIFRGMSQNGTISSLQSQLRGSNLGMREDLSETEERLNKEFRDKNAAAREERWNRMESNEEKAKMDPQRFLREYFLLDEIQGSDRIQRGLDRIPKTVVLKTRHRAELHQAAELLKLETESTDAPWNVDGSRPSIDRWIVISRDRSALAEKIQTIKLDFVPNQTQAQQSKREQNPKNERKYDC